MTDKLTAQERQDLSLLSFAVVPEEPMVATDSVSTAKSTHETRAEWLAARKLGIGGSDASAAVGLSPWKTSLELYLEKIGQIGDTPENDAMYRGRLLEPVIRQMYADATGRQVETPSGIITNPDIPFALANLDGVASGERVLECKTARSRRGWGESDTADIPLIYLIQVSHYMAVTGLPIADVAVMFGDFELTIYEVPRDLEFEAMLLEREAEFWQMVQARIPPSPVSKADVLKHWPAAKQHGGVTATESDRAVAHLLSQMRQHVAECHAWEDLALARLTNRIGEQDRLLYGEEIIATWNNVAGRTGFDAKRLARDYPNLHAQYLTPGKPGRRFLLKERAECLKMETHTTSFPTMPLPALPEPD